MKLKYSALIIVFILSIFISPKFSLATESISYEDLSSTSVTLVANGLLPLTGVTFNMHSHSSNPHAVPYISKTQTAISDDTGRAISEFTGLVAGGKYVGTFNYTGQSATLGTVTFTATGTLSVNDIVSIGLYDFVPTIMGEITGNSIVLTLPAGSSVTSLLPIISVSNGATISPASGVVKDFTDSVTYTVTSYEGEKKVYTVTAFVLNTIPPGMTVNINDITKTSVDFALSGFPYNKEISFDVVNYDSATPTYTDYQTYTIDDNGTGLIQFTGLTPDGHYKYSSSEGPNGSFYTFKEEGLSGGSDSGDGTIGLVTCGTKDNPVDCDFDHLMALINRVINFLLFVMAIPIAAIMFAYAGFMLVTSGGESGKRTKAKEIFTNVALGLIFAAAAWLIIHTLLLIVGWDGSWIGL